MPIIQKQSASFNPVTPSTIKPRSRRAKARSAPREILYFTEPHTGEKVPVFRDDISWVGKDTPEGTTLFLKRIYAGRGYFFVKRHEVVVRETAAEVSAMLTGRGSC